MTPAEERALGAISRVLGWAATAGHAWNPTPFHVEGMQPRAEQLILDGLEDARRASDDSPLGVVIQGRGGTGKTHLLGWVRGQVARAGGYFFLVDFSSGEDFWRQVTRAMVDDLGRATGDGPVQAVVASRALAAAAGVADRFPAGAPITRPELDALVTGLVTRDRRLHRYRDTIRALALYAFGSGTGLDVAHDHLMSVPESADGSRREWGLSQEVKSPDQIAIELSALLAMTGPTVIAVDQIDALLEYSRSRLDGGDPFGDEVPKNVLDEIASGLMALRHVTRRTLCLVACLPSSWNLIKERAIGTVADRFRTSLILSTVGDASLARSLIERRFSAAFAEARFVPPDPVWPIMPSAFASAVGQTPRAVLRRVDAHIEACRAANEVQLMADFSQPDATPAEAARPAEVAPAEVAPAESARPVLLTESALARLDARFAALRDQAEVDEVFDPRREDELVPRLLAAGLESWIREQGEAGHAFSVDPPPGRRPALHARLRLTIDPETEEQRHWTFRMIGARHHIAALSRLNDGIEASGLGPNTPDRHFVVLRNTNWSDGPKTRAALARLADCGGRSLPLSAGDLKVFDALGRMAAELDPDWDAWLQSRRPAGQTELLRLTLATAAVRPDATPTAQPAATSTDQPAATSSSQPTATSPDQPAATSSSSGRPSDTRAAHPSDAPAGLAAADPAAPFSAAGAGQPSTSVRHPSGSSANEERGPGTSSSGTNRSEAVPVGVRMGSGESIQIALGTLAQHVAVFAGSGSGKTVFLRRLVEECALQGVSTIVLDTNNDLARLGDPWPEPPPGWDPGDAGKAARYFADTEVVVWTPGRSSGRPLAFRPLPDFAAIRDDRDALERAVALAAEALASRAKVNGASAKAARGQAVLKEALRYFARSGGTDLDAFLALLADFPFEASGIEQADRIAADLGQNLSAAVIIDPLFAGAGETVDPALLLTPSDGKRARISVISFIGLHDEARPGFVSRLQIALFSWIRRNPARGRPLNGLYVMDEAQSFAPATPKTEALASTLTLASQARKYGLGLVFATQTPRGLHNQIAGNATTQFIGRINSPTQVEVVKSLARARGGSAERVARLAPGQFYATSTGLPETLIRSRLCLSHHPAGPLTDEEVIIRSRH